MNVLVKGLGEKISTKYSNELVLRSIQYRSCQYFLMYSGFRNFLLFSSIKVRPISLLDDV